MSGEVTALPALEDGHARDIEAWLPNADAIVARVAPTAVASLPAAQREALARMGAPGWELVASPYSTRVALLGWQAGVHFVHHERRFHGVDAPDTDAPDTDAPDADRVADAIRWEDGVLLAPRYGAFALEAPLATFDPNHRPKWRPHEVLHRTVGCFWHPEMTRFQAYLGARLAELLPVVHWYGFDEVWRGRCAQHARRQRYKTHCPDCVAAAARAVTQPGAHAPSAGEDARYFADFGRRHLCEELTACVREWETGTRHETFRPRLDASSDAVGYLRGHWERITSWGMGAWMELFMRPGVDHADSIESMLARCVGTVRDILGGTLSWDPERAARLRRRRALQDVGMRALAQLERLDARAEAAAWPALGSLAAASDQLVAGETPPEDKIVGDLRELHAVLEAASLGAGERVFAVGADTEIMDAWPAGPWCTPAAQLAAGLVDGLPDWCAEEAPETLEALAGKFSRAPVFNGSGELRGRFSSWLHETGHPRAEAAALECLVRGRPHRDETAELFGALLPDPPGEPVHPGTLRVNTTFQEMRASAAAAAIVLGWSCDTATIEVGRVWFDGSPRAFLLDADTRRVLDAVRDGRPVADVETLAALVARGVVVWIPDTGASRTNG